MRGLKKGAEPALFHPLIDGGCRPDNIMLPVGGKKIFLPRGKRIYYSLRQTYYDSLFRDCNKYIPVHVLGYAQLPKYIFRFPARTLTDRQRVYSLLFRLVMRLVDSEPWGSLNFRVSRHYELFRMLREGYHTKFWYGPAVRLHRRLKANFALILGFPLNVLEDQGDSLRTDLT